MGDEPPRSPRLDHGRSPRGLDDDHVRAGAAVFHDPGDAVEHGPVAERHEQRIERFGEPEPLKTHRPRALQGLHIQAVLDEPGTPHAGHAPGLHLGLVEVRAVQDHARPERLHPPDLERVRVRAGVDRQVEAPLAAGVRHRLPEVTGARTHQGDALLRLRDQKLRAAALERADRVEGLYLDREPHAELLAERFALELRRVEEHGIYDPGGPLDAP